MFDLGSEKLNFFPKNREAQQTKEIFINILCRKQTDNFTKEMHLLNQCILNVFYHFCHI